ncbi:MAG: enoyl-CoA hydratase-related protein [Pseudomonadota bacterium]
MITNIKLTSSPPVGEIILNAPEKRNAISVAMWAAIPDLVAKAVADTSIKVILIHGGDAGAFAAGADISEFETIYATPESAEASAVQIARALDAVAACEKPVLAAIEGACVGGGVSLAMAADIRIAAQGSKFGVTPGKLGLVYPAGDTQRLIQAVGPGATKEILFTGRIFAAEDAHELGLVDRLVDKGEALQAAKDLAAEIASISQWSVRATKKMIRGLLNGGAPDYASAWQLHLDGFQSEDFKEGYSAFLEKRPAKFTYK